MNRCPSTGKEAFATAAAAHKRIRQLSKRRKDRQDDKFTKGALSAYRCSYCHCWHAGHKNACKPKPRMEAYA